MKYSIVLTTILFLCSFTLFSQVQLGFLEDENLTFQEKVEKAEAHFDSVGTNRGMGFKQYMRWKYMAQRSLDDAGYVLTEENNIAEYESFVAKNGKGQNKSNGTWIEKGPLSAVNTATWSSHIGRLSNIAIDPNDNMHLVVTSLGGGVWKSINEGDTWTPLFDQETTMSLQSALISRANSDHYFIGGSGIWRSLDGGLSFTKLSGPAGTIYSIIMDPVDSNILLASSSNGRVYKTIDGGDTWTNVLLQSSRRFYDLDFKPGDPNTLYACGTNGAMYTSIDKGNSWTPVTGPWNTNRSIMFAVTPHDPEYIYVLQEKSGGFDALYLSTNGGASWTTQSSDDANNNNIMGYSLNNNGGQAPRDMDIIVSPIDKTEVHIAGIMTFKSTDSGVNWTQTTHWVLSNPLPFVHADIDQLIYHGSNIYVASDGGIFISYDGGNSFVDKTTGLGIRQFYRIGASSYSVGKVAGGSQDNGTGILRTDGIWYDYVGADGMEPIILNNDDEISIASIQFGSLYKSINGGTTLTSISQTQGGNNGEWVTPLEKDPNQGNTIYQGKNELYKSTNAGSSWDTISNFTESGNMDELCIAPSNSAIIYASFSERLYKTSDGGENWEQLNLNGLEAFINYICIHPSNPDQVIVAVSNTNRFIETTDGGTTWASIRYNLPNIASRSVAFDGRTENGIYVSLAKGVYFKDNSSLTSWTLMDTGLPKVDAQELEIVNDKIYVATYGRGMWEMDIPGVGFTFSANHELLDCISNGTENENDDAFTFMVNPTGMGLGASYSVSGDVTASSVSYGTPAIFDNGGAGFLKSNGGISITVTDDSNANITSSFTVYPDLNENCYSNYVCGDAFPIEGTGTYYASGPSTGQGGTVSGRNANWFIFVPKSNGKLSINTCNKGQDTNLRIHSGDCSQLTYVTGNDDACPMGDGQNAYASEVIDVPVESSKIYYIEWDNRWSANPFFFEVEFEAECIDFLTVNVTSESEVEFRAATQITIEGSLEGYVGARTSGVVSVNDLTLQQQSNLNIINETCELNDIFDSKVSSSEEVLIPDNGSIEISFEFPSSITQTIGNMAIGIDIAHPDISQLTLTLIKPDGTEIPFWEEYCNGESDLNFILDINAFEKDQCGVSWRQGYPIYEANTFSSVEISNIVNENMAGEWKIRFQDVTSGVQGRVNHAFIYFKE